MNMYSNQLRLILFAFGSFLVHGWHTTAVAETTVPEAPGLADVILSSGTRKNLKNDVLPSANGSVFLTLDYAGDLVIKLKCDSTTVWEQSIRFHSDAQVVSMERNGNFIVYGPFGNSYWQTNTSGNPGADLRLQNDGYLCVFSGGRCIWSNGYHSDRVCVATTIDPEYISTTPGPLDPNGTILRAGETKDPRTTMLQSPNKTFRLQFTGMGDVEVVREADDVVIWQLQIPGVGKRFGMEQNGNLIVYGGSSPETQYVAWEAHTDGNPGADLRLDDDGHLCVYKNGRCLWSNGIRLEPHPAEATPPERSDIVLISGQSQNDPKFVLYSARHRVTLSLDNVGDLVIRKVCDNTIIWKQPVEGIGKSITMKTNGNFVVHKFDHSVAWQTGTIGRPGADLRLLDDGFLCVYKEGTGCVWSNGKRFHFTCSGVEPFLRTIEISTPQTAIESNPDPHGIILRSGETENPREVMLQSPNRLAYLTFDNSHDIVVLNKSDNTVLWKQFVRGLAGRVRMELDGNFVVYTAVPHIGWETGTYGNPGADLRLEDDGRLCVYKDGRCIWENMEAAGINSTITSASNLRLSKAAWCHVVLVAVGFFGSLANF